MHLHFTFNLSLRSKPLGSVVDWLRCGCSFYSGLGARVGLALMGPGFSPNSGAFAEGNGLEQALVTLIDVPIEECRHPCHPERSRSACDDEVEGSMYFL
jgi:hypothetical protein